MTKSRLDEGSNPYPFSIPPLKRPTQNGLSRPVTEDEKMYCWFFWIDKILDARYTRVILDELDNMPEFSATWGPAWEKGDKLYQKNYSNANLYK